MKKVKLSDLPVQCAVIARSNIDDFDVALNRTLVDLQDDRYKVVDIKLIVDSLGRFIAIIMYK